MQIEVGLFNLKCSRWVILFPIRSLGTGHSQSKILRVIGSIMWRAMQSLCSWWDTINGTYKASITWSFIVPHCFENSKSILQLYRISQTLRVTKMNKSFSSAFTLLTSFLEEQSNCDFFQ